MNISGRTVVKPAITGAVCSVLGFIISFSSERTITGNGTASCSFTDFGPLLFGSIAFLAGVNAVRQARASSNPTLNFVLGGLSIVIGTLHVVRGFGFIGGPCN